MKSGATFSPCRKYRYTLMRVWGDGSRVNFVMLNPSTADEVTNDPTVERCERRARAWGYGGLIVTNLFAWRATDPSELRKCSDPIGPDNDRAIVESAQRSGMVVCAWGNHGSYLGRGAAVARKLAAFVPHCLRLAKTGHPCHPLYLPYSLTPQVWDLPSEAWR